MGKSDIQWTDRTVNAIRARNIETGKIGFFCEHASPGCIGCYSESINKPYGTGLDYIRQNRDKVEIFLDPVALQKLRRLRKDQKIFPCSMTDLFGEFVTDEMIDLHIATAAKEPRHTFQLLTKRTDRMLAYFNRPPRDPVNRASMALFDQPAFPSQSLGMIEHPGWPLPNTWVGCSVEDQRRANERREDMRRLAEMGWLTWVSYEPAFENIDWTGWEFLRWIVVGGQSGRNAKEFQIRWPRKTLAWCRVHGVAFFMKQLGKRPFNGLGPMDRWPTPNDPGHGGDILDFPADLRVREFPIARAA